MTARWIAATLVHNTPELAARMREQLPGVLVIDNGSHPPIDGAAISLPVNRGFVGGWNEAMRRIIAEHPDVDYVWMLNSDVEGVTHDMGDSLMMDCDFDEFAVSTPVFNSPHSVFSVRPTNERAQTLRSVSWVDWCCPMVPVYVWESVGEFDTRSTGYFADVDWCKRARDAGYRFCVSEPHEVHHIGGATARAIGHTWDADDRWLCEKWGVKSWTELT